MPYKRGEFPMTGRFILAGVLQEQQQGDHQRRNKRNYKQRESTTLHFVSAEYSNTVNILMPCASPLAFLCSIHGQRQFCSSFNTMVESLLEGITMLHSHPCTCTNTNYSIKNFVRVPIPNTNSNITEIIHGYLLEALPFYIFNF